MKVKKLEIFQNKIGLKGCKWSSLNAPGTETPLSHPYWKLQEFPFSIFFYSLVVTTKIIYNNGARGLKHSDRGIDLATTIVITRGKVTQKP